MTKRTTSFNSIKGARRRKELFEKQEGKCHWCGYPMTLEVAPENGRPFWDYASFEHLLARQDGGRHGEENLVLAHYACNHERHRAEPKQRQR